MRRLSLTAHGALEYALIGALSVAPALFPPGTPRIAAIACYSAVAVLCLLALGTRYPLGLFRALSLEAHRIAELVLAPALIVLPWLAGFARFPVACAVFVIAGAALLLVSFATDYEAAHADEVPHEPPIDRGAVHHRGP